MDHISELRAICSKPGPTIKSQGLCPRTLGYPRDAPLSPVILYDPHFPALFHSFLIISTVVCHTL